MKRVWPWLGLWVLTGCAGSETPDGFAPLDDSGADAATSTVAADAAAPDAAVDAAPSRARDASVAADASAVPDSSPPSDASAAADTSAAPDATPATCPVAGKAATMIDDGSQLGPNAGILQQCGRFGYWGANNDGTTLQTPPLGGPFGPFLTSDPPNGVTGYIRTVGTLASNNWGAMVVFAVSEPAQTLNPYDASAYRGISFWVKAGATNDIPSYWFAVPDEQTYNIPSHPYHQISVPTPAPGVWTYESFTWSELTQPSWTTGTPTPFDPTALMYVQWNFGASGSDQTFDISIGDIEFLPF